MISTRTSEMKFLKLNDFVFIKKSLRYLKPYKIRFILLLSSVIFLILLSTIQPLIWGKLLANILSKRENLAIIGLFIVIALAQALSTFLQSYLSSRISNCIIRDLRKEMYCKILNLPIKAFDDIKLGEFLSRLNNDIGAVSILLTQYIINILINVLRVLTVGVTILVLNRVLALIIVISFPFSFFIFRISGKMLRKNNQITLKLNDKFYSNIQQSLLGIREITSLGIINNRLQSFKALVDSLMMQNIKMTLIGASAQLLGNVVTLMSQTLLIGVGAYYIYIGTLKIEYFVAFISYFGQFSGSLLELFNTNVSIQQALVSLERVFDLIDNNLGYRIKSFGIKQLNRIDSITFNNVDFEYSPEKRVLNKINFHLPRNSMTAIVGRNGCGKSTVFNLLLRFYDPIMGKVLINNIDISELDNPSSLISILRQEPQLFNMTIKENLELGMAYVNEEDMYNACKTTNIHDYIMSLPNKYDTIINENSVNLSIGQKQRIALARILLKETPILLFDEPTTALDKESEYIISNIIKKMAKDHIVVVISHNLSTIIESDQIFVMDKGQIIGQGTHDYLINNNTIYQLFNEKELPKTVSIGQAVI